MSFRSDIAHHIKSETFPEPSTIEDFMTTISKSVSAITAVLSLLGSSTVDATDILVEPVRGTANAVIEAALAEAEPGDRVVLRAGEYRLDGPVEFPHEGEQGKPITLCAASTEYVALLGSVRLTGWQRHEGNIWKVKHPGKQVKGLYEDGERLTHPRPDWGKRVDPPLSELKAPGTWTQDEQWIYLWSRESDSPDRHRIEASQNHVMNVNRPWIRVEGLHMFFGQNLVCQITADHCEVVRCEIAHCSNSVDNSYNAYLSGCSHSAFRHCVMHDSYYWGDHGSNSHTMSTINCGDDGPNFVDGCEIFNGGLGVGTKGAVRELVVRNCHIYDQVNGIVTSGERANGPGAGKTDRGHYLIWKNRISDCRKGVWISSGKTHENRIWNNVIQRCDNGFAMRNVGAVPDRPHLANNIFRDNEAAVYMVAGRDGTEKISIFVQAGVHSHHNLFFGNQADWQSPLTWGRSLNLMLPKVQTFQDLGLEQGSLSAEPKLDRFGHSQSDCPALGQGAQLPLPPYIDSPRTWHIGLGPSGSSNPHANRGLILSIKGSTDIVAPGEPVKLAATLKNANSRQVVDLGQHQDVILTFHFRYRGGHRDKQELHRCRVELPSRRLQPDEQLDLTQLPGWSAPVNGKLGDPFHLRVDTKQWRRGCRLRATARFVNRHESTQAALQQLTSLLRSREVLSMEFAADD